MFENWKNWSLKLAQFQQQQQQPSSPYTESSTTDINRNPTASNIVLDQDFTAGCDLLAKYEIDWETIHKLNEENIMKSDVVAMLIEKLQEDMKGKCLVMDDILTLSSGIPMLKEKLKSSKEAIEDIIKCSNELETRLEKLEDICEECDFQELMLQKQCELAQYKQKTLADLEAYRKRIAVGHEDKIRQHEERLRSIQRERQAVFDEAFRNDLEEYKVKGSLPKIEKAETQQRLALEEVILDVDAKDALENFLNG